MGVPFNTCPGVGAGKKAINTQSEEQQQNLEGPTDEAQQCQPGAPNAVWALLCRRDVLLECLLVFPAQITRGVIDILLPLAMMTTPTWLVGMVYLTAAVGSILAPFVLDQVVLHCPRYKHPTCAACGSNRVVWLRYRGNVAEHVFARSVQHHVCV